MQSNKGFTLIELIIYLGIIGTILSSFIIYSLTIMQSRNKNYVTQEVQANNRIAIELIAQTIRESTGVNFASSTFDTDPGVLSLAMADVSKDPTIISLNQDNGILQITQGTASPENITTNLVSVTDLRFTNLTGTNPRASIKFTLTTAYLNPERDPAFEYNQTIDSSVTLRQ